MNRGLEQGGLRGKLILFGPVILLNAFLLFLVQPLIARLILPWFGGTAVVWTTCMLFFQLVLLAGYGYAHILTQLKGSIPFLVHGSCLVCSLIFLPIIPSPALRPAGGTDPVSDILILLGVTVGLPYMLLSSTSPLLQSWYSRTTGGGLPWRFFALSNAGSLAGLLSYPFLVEPWLTTRWQALLWSSGYLVCVLACLGIVWTVWRRGQVAPVLIQVEVGGLSARDLFLWLALPCSASLLLLSITNHMTQNLAAIPLFWILPLSLYLLSFILCFGSDFWYQRRLFLPLGLAALIFLIHSYGADRMQWPIRASLPIYCLAAFSLFMVCHGELARRRPATGQLTFFYLMISVGGAIGGAAVAVLAPLLTNAMYDLPLAIGLTCFLFLYVVIVNYRPQEVDCGVMFLRTPLEWTILLSLAIGILGYAGVRLVDSAATAGLTEAHDFIPLGGFAALLLFLLSRATRTRHAVTLAVVAMAGFAILANALLAREAFSLSNMARLQVRNAYGALTINDQISAASTMGRLRALSNGTVLHGSQFIDPRYSRHATTYYANDSGIGLTLRSMMSRAKLRVGVVGLGAGTIATYSRAEDYYRFYEINPLVRRIANEQFTFLRDAAGTHDVVLGDARSSLEKEPSQQFDVLAVDAFSGDSIPVHLLTREAFRLYWQHLTPNGVLAVHVSNTYLSLAPVVLMASFESNRSVRMVTYLGNDSRAEAASAWVLVSSDDSFFDHPLLSRVATTVDPLHGLRTWTDDFSNLLRLFH